MIRKTLKHTDSLEFILAGKATFTFLNTQTGNRFTYKCVKKKDIHFVYVLTGPDTYQFIGSIFNKNYKHSKKSKISDTAPSVLVFSYVFKRLVDCTLQDFIEIWHEGNCGRCGRPLTVPESIESGYGPICIGLTRKNKNSYE